MATTNFIPATVSKALAQPSAAVATVFEQYSRLSVDERLGLLWFTYLQLGKSITPAAPGAARLQLAEGLLNQIRAMQPSDQLQVMRDIAGRANTPESRAYGVFSANTKLGFWYQLAVWMEDGSVISVPVGYQLTPQAKQVLGALSNLQMSQQITVLRSAANDMGVDLFA